MHPGEDRGLYGCLRSDPPGRARRDVHHHSVVAPRALGADEAGADIVETNTFSSTRIAQADYGMEEAVYDLNRDGARLAKRALLRAEREDGRRRFVAGAIGPTNRTLSISPDVNNPGYRAVTFDGVKQAYVEQVRGLDRPVDLGDEHVVVLGGAGQQLAGEPVAVERAEADQGGAVGGAGAADDELARRQLGRAARRGSARMPGLRGDARARPRRYARRARRSGATRGRSRSWTRPRGRCRSRADLRCSRAGGSPERPTPRPDRWAPAFAVARMNRDRS